MNRRQVIIRVSILLVVVVAIGGAVYGGRALWGAKIGGRCDDNFSCQPGSICISRRCQQTCKADGDCPAEWSCRDTSVWITTEGGPLTKRNLESGTERICFSPEAMRGTRAREQQAAAQQAEHQAALDAILKEQAVFNAVLMKTLPVFGKPHVEVGKAAFDKAWAQIPANDRRALTADALADRVVQLATHP